jgi:hypothetical protein
VEVSRVPGGLLLTGTNGTAAAADAVEQFEAFRGRLRALPRLNPEQEAEVRKEEAAARAASRAASAREDAAVEALFLDGHLPS